MGATNITTEIKATSVAAFQKKMKKIQKEETIQYGTDPYAGHWGNVDSFKECYAPEFKTVKRWTKQAKWKAFDYMEERVEKWEAGLYIRTKDSFLVCACVAI